MTSPATDIADQPTRAGIVALIGASNAGKSTLMNAMVGQKVSIVTPKVQTTRSRIRVLRWLETHKLFLSIHRGFLHRNDVLTGLWSMRLGWVRRMVMWCCYYMIARGEA